MIEFRARRAAVITAAAFLTGCFSNSPIREAAPRMPANANVTGVYDDFSNKGYIEATEGRKMQSGSHLKPEQITSELAGREIWYKSAPNGRFHTYIFGQRANAPIDWYKVLRTDQRWQRFNIWGTVNDPDCCTPGRDCDAKGLTLNGRSVTLTDTYGLDFCRGDETLLGFVGRPDRDYTKSDPACTNPAVQEADKQKPKPLESSCELAFGTSAGMVGFRKFPNPRFNAARWSHLGGWEGYEKRNFEGSMEPPFRIALACASCHASFDPIHPPKDFNKPDWFNISGTVGNQYERVSQILGSGTKSYSLEWQLFIPMSRAGTTDTSAVPNDMIINPGTMNAIINFVRRPQFTDLISRWDPVPSCPPNSKLCQSVQYNNDPNQVKSWQYSTSRRPTFHILKGGEDSVGVNLAVQRVYINIGMCAEQCWMNHHTDLRALSPHDRGFKQTAFDIAQCRRDCAPWRANEDHAGDIVNFLLSGRPFDLKEALRSEGKIGGASSEEVNANFTDFVENNFKMPGGKPASIDTGRQLFARNCASCHSSQNSSKIDDRQQAFDDFSQTDFLAETTLPESGEIVRADWMGNDKSTDVNFVGTYQCRSLHSNHKAGHLWSEFASKTYKNRPGTVRDTRGNLIDGGPGYYRNISLLSLWAFAPFMHNNAMGPEVCGRPSGMADVHYNTHVGQQTGLNTMHKCDAEYDPTVEGRLDLFDKSMDELLTAPESRPKKLSVAAETIRLPLGLNLKSLGLGHVQKFYLEFPIGTPISVIGSLDYKVLISDIMGSLPFTDPSRSDDFNKYWEATAGKSCGPRMAEAVRGTLSLISQSMTDVADAQGHIHDAILDHDNDRLKTYEDCYSTCNGGYENLGHRFMTNATAEEKASLKAFLSTL